MRQEELEGHRARGGRRLRLKRDSRPFPFRRTLVSVVDLANPPAVGPMPIQARLDLPVWTGYPGVTVESREAVPRGGFNAGKGALPTSEITEIAVAGDGERPWLADGDGVLYPGARRNFRAAAPDGPPVGSFRKAGLLEMQGVSVCGGEGRRAVMDKSTKIRVMVKPQR